MVRRRDRTEDAYNEICGVLVENAPIMFKIEQLLLELLSQETPVSTKPELVLYPRSSFQRMLIHMLCSYYKLDHVSLKWKTRSVYASCRCCILDTVEDRKKMHISRIPKVTMPLNRMKQLPLSEIYKKLRPKHKWTFVEEMELQMQRSAGYAYIGSKPELQIYGQTVASKSNLSNIKSIPMKNIVQVLPTDCMLFILEYLTAIELINIGQISHEWYMMSSVDRFWKPKVIALAEKKQVSNAVGSLGYRCWKTKYFELNSILNRSTSLCGCKLGNIYSKHEHPGHSVPILYETLNKY